MILYPTETLYALGVNACDAQELVKLYAIKERERKKPASWLVRDLADMEKYAKVPEKAAKLAASFLPGPLTLVLKAKMHLSDEVVAGDRTISFRISSDPIAQQLIAEFMEKNNAPLTCTSANISGAPTLSTPGEILQQLGPQGRLVDRIIDDGPRKSLASTIVRVIDDEVTILREGEITEDRINAVL